MTDRVMESASDMSNSHVGIGKIRTVIIAIIPSASMISPRKIEERIPEIEKSIPLEGCCSAIKTVYGKRQALRIV
jgi:hypothetical protein